MDIKVAAIPDAGLHVVDTCKNTHFTVSYCIFCKEIIAVTMDSPRKDSSYPEEYDKEELPKSRWDFFDAILQRDMQIRDFKPDREKIMNALKSYIQVKEYATRGKGLHFNQYDTLLTGNVEALLYGYMPMTNQRIKRLKELESELAALKVKSKFLI